MMILMKTILYEVNQHYTGYEIPSYTVSKLRVIRKSVLPGCTSVSITASDSRGRIFRRSPKNYYETEEAAWDAIKVTLLAAREITRLELEHCQSKLESIDDQLYNLGVEQL